MIEIDVHALERVMEDIAHEHAPEVTGGLLVCAGCRQILPTLTPSDRESVSRVLREHWTAVLAVSRHIDADGNFAPPAEGPA